MAPLALSSIAPEASPEETAAIVAAVEQFLRDTAPPPAPAGGTMSPWLRAALVEGVERDPWDQLQ